MFVPLLIVAAHHLRPEQLTPKQAERIAYAKCGPDGTVDWDDNPEYPPPHCNRNGWNGHRYVEPRKERR
jgi:hypothetical protein